MYSVLYLLILKAFYFLAIKRINNPMWLFERQFVRVDSLK